MSATESVSALPSPPLPPPEVPAQYVLFHYPAVLKPYRTSFNSWFASLVAVSTGFPLDSVKTRLQTYKYKGNWHCIVDTYKNEGVLGFYRGESCCGAIRCV